MNERVNILWMYSLSHCFVIRVLHQKLYALKWGIKSKNWDMSMKYIGSCYPCWEHEHITSVHVVHVCLFRRLPSMSRQLKIVFNDTRAHISTDAYSINFDWTSSEFAQFIILQQRHHSDSTSNSSGKREREKKQCVLFCFAWFTLYKS